MSAPSSAEPLRILVVGVGGQGVLTIARFLGEAALSVELDVRLGQLHGMSQRGGSVEATVLLGPGSSSFIGPGEADVVLGLEPLEALRARPRMSRATRVVVNLGRVVPYPLAMQGRPYPPLEGVLAEIRDVCGRLVEIDGPEVCADVGSARALNVVMLGALAGLSVLPFDADALRQAIADRSPARLAATNRKAFDLGLEAVQQATA
ncbi:MAG: indolepyruvate oxidoreductase subunit beta [Deltaproteobacteria bacterium]|jgi:indolepyruvate ferredoxin oxidoreductase beta subunit|nr:indolepyruvate oxidoreductase subunit beta [Deltaproteobacteria bacterium]MBW2535824.1 indolepyruvate oxidoreductase subunit beta [Deltaproteobacteria bacterium]